MTTTQSIEVRAVTLSPPHTAEPAKAQRNVNEGKIKAEAGAIVNDKKRKADDTLEKSRDLKRPPDEFGFEDLIDGVTKALGYNKQPLLKDIYTEKELKEIYEGMRNA